MNGQTIQWNRPKIQKSEAITYQNLVYENGGLSISEDKMHFLTNDLVTMEQLSDIKRNIRISAPTTKQISEGSKF